MILAAWPAPDNVVALTTTRQAPAGVVAVSGGAYAEFNLARHVDDNPLAVTANRASLYHHLQPQGLTRIRDGSEVAAAHAGWRGLCNGVLAQTVVAFESRPRQLLAWLGPAVSAQHFEVGEDVLQAFVREFSGPSVGAIEAAFVPRAGLPGKYLADLYQLARLQLKSLGVDAIYGGEHCTVAENSLFYSYRRQPRCGRQASIIALREA